MAFSNPITGGQGALIRPAIKSPNYNPGVAGWTINRDGSAEFNNLTIRGTFFGTSYILNTAGAFFYNGAPAAGNLVLSIASVAGNDSFGNAYVRGLGTYAASVNTYQLDSSTGNVEIGTVAAAHWLFDVVNSQSTMFDKNALLTMEMSAQVGNSFFFWLSNLAKQFFAVVDGALLFGTLTTAGALPTGSDQVNAAHLSLVTGTTPALQVNSLRNTSGSGSSGLTMQLYSGNPVVSGPGSTNNAKMALLGSGGGSADIELFGGALYRGDLGGQQFPTLGAGWSTAAIRSAPPIFYYIDGGDTLWIRGAVDTTSVTPAGIVFTLPAAYTPQPGVNLQQDIIFKQTAAGAGFTFGHLFISGSNVTLNGLTYAVGDIVNFNHSFALGNLP